NFWQAGDQRIRFSVFGVAGNPAPRIDPEGRTTGAARKGPQVGFDAVAPLESVSRKAVGHITKPWIRIGRGSIRKPYKDALCVAELGDVVKNRAETEQIGHTERVEVALRPAERTDVDELIVMVMVQLKRRWA